MGRMPASGRSQEAVEDIAGRLAESGYGLAYDDSQGLIKKTRDGPNPYDQADTFSESRLSKNLDNTLRTVGQTVGLEPYVGVDDVEDGSMSDWSEGTAQTNVVKWGTYAARWNTAYSASVPGPSHGDTTKDAIFAVRCSKLLDGDSQWWRLMDSGGNKVVQLDMDMQNGQFDTHGTSNVHNLAADTWYVVRFSPDFGSDVYDLSINGSQVVSNNSLATATSGWDHMDLRKNDSNSTNGSAYLYLDSPYKGPVTSGFGRLSWTDDRDPSEWDTMTYTKAVNNETVDVYVAYNDGTGWSRANGGNPVTPSDLPYDLAADSAISPSDDVGIELEISRTNTSNDPRFQEGYVSWMV